MSGDKHIGSDLYSREHMHEAGRRVMPLVQQFLAVEHVTHGVVIAATDKGKELQTRAMKLLEEMGYHSIDAEQLFYDSVLDAVQRRSTPGMVR